MIRSFFIAVNFFIGFYLIQTTGYTQCPTGDVSGNVTLTSSCTINTSIEIDGNLYLNGDLTLTGGAVLTVTGDIIVNYVGSTTTYTVSGGTINANAITTNNNSILAFSTTEVNLTNGYTGGYHGGLTLSSASLHVGAGYTEDFQGGGGPVTLNNSTITTGGDFFASQFTDYVLINNSSIEVGGNFSTGNSVDFTVTDSQLDVNGTVNISQYSNFLFTDSEFGSGGALTTNNGVVIDLDGSDLNVSSGNLTNGYQASITASNGSSISVSNGDFVMSNESSFDVTNSDVIIEGNLDNNWLADIDINSGSTVYVTEDVANDGSITVDGGTLSYGGSYSGTATSSTSGDTACGDGCCGDCSAYDNNLERTKSNIYGAWETNSNWVDGTAPSRTNISSDVSIFGYIYTGGSVTTASSGAKTMTIFDTLVVYGNLTFRSNSDILDIKPGGVLVVMGDLTLKNQITVASGGIIAVSGNFTKEGSSGQGSYSGDGVVYAGSFDSGDDAWVDGGGGSDQSKTIDQLSDDGYIELENFITGGGVTPLPITLQSFKAEKVNQSVYLQWVTSSELNNDFFTISKSRDGVEFTEIARVAGSGDSNELNSYSYTDPVVLDPVIYYQLSQTDFDGTTEIVAVERVGNPTANIKLSLYPNPVQQNFVTVQNATADMKWELLDLYGVALQSGDFLYSNEIQLNATTPCGVYLMKVSGPDFTTLIRLVKK
ncbi:T9SS type A sorting domain-containing protein [Marinoscillum pacificum]|uniref:T9SS type A sorting domain-containing protein n=1 Tax=Marinoscillum pacificum TaxID=392723 RepID=UPI00215849E1|nr:T9SS type A sorting domain-containing protein [Marinoscillum pacificum]